MKCSDHIFILVKIHTGLSSHTAVDLCQKARRNLDKTNSTQIGRRCIACQIADHAASQRQNRGPPVDTQTEQLIQQAIDHLLQDRTSFLIAHRLSTIRKADMILVVRDGRIVEQGTHQELLRRHGYYHDLYSKQFAEESAARILQ